MAFQDVDILLRARDQYSQGIDEFIRKMDEANRSAETAGQATANQMAQTLISMDALVRLADQGINTLADNLMKMHVEGASGFDVLIGSVEGLVSALEKVPIAGGLGRALAVPFDKFLFGSAMAKEVQNSKAIDKMLEESKYAERLAKYMSDTADKLSVEQQKISDAFRVEVRDGLDLSIVQLDIQERDALANIAKLRERRLTTEQAREVADLQQHTETLFTLRRMMAQREAAAEAEAERMKLEKASEAAQALADAKAKVEITLRRRMASDVASVEAEIRQAVLRAQGRDMAAELEALREQFRKRIEIARESGNQELAARLAVLERIKAAEAQNAGALQLQSQSVSAFETRFLRRLPASERANSDLPAIRAGIDRMNQTILRSNALLEKIEGKQPEFVLEN